MDETDWESDTEDEDDRVEHSLTERRLDMGCTGCCEECMDNAAAYDPPSCSSRRPRYRCSLRSWSLCEEFFRSWRSKVCNITPPHRYQKTVVAFIGSVNARKNDTDLKSEPRWCRYIPKW